MIIFGTTTTTKQVGEGGFFCPSCTSRQNYALKRLKRWFHLYWIPLIPLEELHRWVQCLRCESEYKEIVLEYDPEKEAREFRNTFVSATKSALLRIALSDGDITPNRSLAIARALTNLSGEDVSPEDVSRYAELVRDDQRSMREVLSPIAGRLTEHGKEMLVRASVIVAAADAETVSKDAASLIIEIGSIVDMSSAHLRGVVAEVLDNRSRPEQIPAAEQIDAIGAPVRELS